MTNTELGVWFRQAFGDELPLEASSWPTHHQGDLVWVSDSLRGTGVVPPMTPGFLDQPADYVIAGYWGHGVNSSAFYYVTRRGPHRAFFRLALGGAYGDRAADVALALDFLGRYQELCTRELPRLRASTLIHNMGESVAQLELEGPPIRVAGEADFWGAVARAVARPSPAG